LAASIENQGMPVPGDGKNAEGWSSQDKFAVVLETAALNEAELAEYCRRRGLFVEQIAAWREACRTANATAGEQARSQREPSKNVISICSSKVIKGILVEADMSRKHYPSDINREQFEKIRGMLEGSRRKQGPGESMPMMCFVRFCIY
jgi:hypothetical protein